MVTTTDPIAASTERAVGGLVVAALAVAVMSGLVLTFVYRPGDHAWLRTVHAGSSAVAVISAIAAAVVRRGGRLRVSRRSAVKVVLLVVILGGVFATGSLLAWTGGQPGDRGVFLDAGHVVVVDGALVEPSELVVSFVVHVILGLCAVGVLGWEYVRAWWQRRSLDPRSAPRPPAP